MKYIYIGDIVGTHGIKGEVKVVSDFEYKDLVFCKGMKIYSGKRKEKLIVKTARKHKIYNLLTFLNMDDINDVITLKGDSLYIDRCDIKIDTYLKQDLIGMDVYDNDKLIGKVSSIMKNKAHDILIVNNGEKRYLIPHVKEYIKNVNLKDNKININVIEGLLNEN